MICNMNQNLMWVKISSSQYLNKRFSHHPLGMKEPMASRGQHVSTLDLLIMPLLACDHLGTRIGMGGGYSMIVLWQVRRIDLFVWVSLIHFNILIKLYLDKNGINRFMAY